MLPLQLKSAKAGTENAINVESKNNFFIEQPSKINLITVTGTDSIVVL
ncbi:hypothetical protein [Acinetobacter towneri]